MTSKKQRKSKKMTDVMPVLSASVRGEEVSSAIDTWRRLEGNGEEQLFETTMMEHSAGAEDAPSVMFGWQNVEVFVQAIQAAQAQAAAWCGSFV